MNWREAGRTILSVEDTIVVNWREAGRTILSSVRAFTPAYTYSVSLSVCLFLSKGLHTRPIFSVITLQSHEPINRFIAVRNKKKVGTKKYLFLKFNYCNTSWALYLLYKYTPLCIYSILNILLYEYTPLWIYSSMNIILYEYTPL